MNSLVNGLKDRGYSRGKTLKVGTTYLDSFYPNTPDSPSLPKHFKLVVGNDFLHLVSGVDTFKVFKSFFSVHGLFSFLAGN